jgi:hypothetical protein
LDSTPTKRIIKNLKQKYLEIGVKYIETSSLFIIIIIIIIETANGFSPGGSGTTIRQQTITHITTIRQQTNNTRYYNKTTDK